MPSRTPRSQRQHEDELWEYIYRTTGALAPGRPAGYAGVRLFVKYLETHTCPCGAYFPPSSSPDKLVRQIWRHLKSQHPGTHFWTFNSYAFGNLGNDMVILKETYPGAEIVAFRNSNPPMSSVTLPASSDTHEEVPQYSARRDIQNGKISYVEFSPAAAAEESYRLDFEAEGDEVDCISLDKDSLVDYHMNDADCPPVTWCVCVQPDDGRFMVGCDGCQDWFHPDCVGTTKLAILQLGSRAYFCPACSDLSTADEPSFYGDDTDMLSEDPISVKSEATSMKSIDSPTPSPPHPGCTGHKIGKWPQRVDPMKTQGLVFGLRKAK